LEILDCHVSSAFEGDEAKLAEWRQARRVQAKPGARREDVSATVVGAVEEQVERALRCQLQLPVPQTGHIYYNVVYYPVD
jgi:hypothetical protein